MSEVAAVGEVHAKDAVTGLEHREIGHHVGLGAAVRLDVHVFRSREKRESAFLRQPLGHVDELAAAVVALAGQALRVLVGEPRPLGLHDGAESVVLAGDQLDLVVLSVPLTLHRRPQLRIDIGDARPAQS